MPRVSVALLGDPDSLIRSFKNAGRAGQTFQRELASVSVSAKKSADIQIQAALKKDARLRSEIASYRAVASAASRGSREQIVAANLAAQAEGRLSRSLAVTAREARIHSRALTTSERSLGRLTRGAVAGSGAFRGLGRSLAFASSAFLGGAGLSFALRSTISAAAETQLVNRQLARSLQAVGLSYAANREQINQTIEAQAKLSAFDDEELKRSFTSFARRTGDVTKALQLNALAADVARARNISLQASAQLLIRALAGNARAATTLQLPLADLGKNASKAAVAQSILASAQARYAGQAAAFGRTAAGAQGRFNKALQDSEEIIGGALLQVLPQLAERVSAYLTRINKTGELQRKVNSAVRFGGELLGALKDIFIGLSTVLGPVNRLLGGTANTVKALALALASVKLGGLIGSLGLIGSEAGVAAGGVTGLTGALLALAAIKSVSVSIHLLTDIKGGKIKAALGDLANLLPGQHVGIPGTRFQLNTVDLVSRLFGGGSKNDNFRPGAEDGSGPGVHGALLTNEKRRERLRAAALQAALNARAAAARARTRAEAALEHSLSLFELAATRARLTKSLTDDQRVLRNEETFLRRELRNHNLSAKKRLDVEKQIAQVELDLAENQRQIAQQAQEARAKALARRNARQFRVLGLGSTGDVLAPTKKALRAELGTIGEAVKGTFLDTSAQRGVLRNIRRLLSGELGALSTDVRNKIRELLDDLKNQLSDFDGFNLTAADRRRRFLDQRRADRYAGRPDHPSHGGNTYNYNTTVHADEPQKWEKASKRVNWRLRNA